MSTKPVGYAVERGIATITLNRPDVSNAFDLEAAAAFREAIGRADETDEVRAVLLRAEGRNFCAGGDLSSVLHTDDPPAAARALARNVDTALRGLTDTDKPVVAAVQGAVAGAGLAVVLRSDVVIAAHTARFIFAFTKAGLSPDCGVSTLLPRAIGVQRALDLAFTGRVLTAQDAASWGLVADVVDPGLLASKTAGLAQALADGPAFALRATKRLLRGSLDASPATQAAAEVENISAAISDPQTLALLRRFSARR